MLQYLPFALRRPTHSGDDWVNLTDWARNLKPRFLGKECKEGKMGKKEKGKFGGFTQRREDAKGRCPVGWDKR